MTHCMQRRALLAGVLILPALALAGCGAPDPLRITIALEPGQLASMRRLAGDTRAARSAAQGLIEDAFAEAERGDSDLDQAAVTLLTFYVADWIGADVGTFPPGTGYDSSVSATSESDNIEISMTLDGARFDLSING